MSMDTDDELAGLRTENTRLIVMLDAYSIAWCLPEPGCFRAAPTSTLSAGNFQTRALSMGFGVAVHDTLSLAEESSMTQDIATSAEFDSLVPAVTPVDQLVSARRLRHIPHQVTHRVGGQPVHCRQDTVIE